MHVGEKILNVTSTALHCGILELSKHLKLFMRHS